MNGKLIALEGLDGSGKETQTRLLEKALKERGIPVKEVSFPDYESESSALVKMYLKGEFGTHPSDVNAYAASLFYAVDRFASYRMHWQSDYEAGSVVLADRYTTANAVHQCSKLPRAQWDDFLAWLFDLEYGKVGLPRPAGVFFLDMSPEVSRKLISRRYGGEETRRDIHERDLAYLERSREAALYCAEKLGWYRIACDDGNEPFSIDTLHERILAEADKLLLL